MSPIITVAIAIISGIICFSITKNRNTNTNEYIWGGFGVLIGPQLIPFCFIPKKTNKNEIEVESKNVS